jgi:hypothetical protein
MDGTLQAFLQFLRENGRAGFALFAAGVSTWVLVRYGLIKDDAIQIPLAYLACFGLFIGLGYVGAKTAQSLVVRPIKALQSSAGAQRTALLNLNMISREEFNALMWCYHKGISRIRADQNNPTIERLEEMQIIRVDDHTQPWRDRFFIVPPYVTEALAKRLGNRNPDSVSDEPPWLDDDRRV